MLITVCNKYRVTLQQIQVQVTIQQTVLYSVAVTRRRRTFPDFTRYTELGNLTRTQRAWGRRSAKKSHADVGLVVRTKQGRAVGHLSGDHADGFFRALALEGHSPKRHMAILCFTPGNGCKLDPERARFSIIQRLD
ncbi:hypothetical protein TESG_08455 [Trichophyton tonsurans CBS 112818]|uniref:Uncharacterized protein n=1 Tax=Trichophyton tonsurans (strain CBS 112818) TaxID=647933 RepID=F2RZJ1_TRIT1|nr:hypothetical protein TESG_08455 [Trichophyton tonsurans CBS 112818]